MKKMMRGEEGQTIVEYVMMLAVAVMVVAIVSTYLKDPMARLIIHYGSQVSKVVEKGDTKHGAPNEQGKQRFVYK